MILCARCYQADISLRLKESTDLLEAILALQARDANAPVGQRPDDVVLAVSQEVLTRMPGKLKHRDVRHSSSIAALFVAQL